jgi:hypothetical protein
MVVVVVVVVKIVVPVKVTVVVVAAGGIFKPLNCSHSDLKKYPPANCHHFYNMTRNFED